MNEQWFILADDLTGAADSAIAFARRGRASRVVWDMPSPFAVEIHANIDVLAFNADSRSLSPEFAARVTGDVLRRFRGTRGRLFKKIDSTLRGHPGAEIAATLDAVIEESGTACGIFAAAYPAMGRTMRDGRVFVNDEPLETTPFGFLEAAGLRTELIPLTTVRAGRGALRSAFSDLARGNAECGVVAVCDSQTQDDLDRIAAASLTADESFVFIGSGGLAQALAGADDEIKPANSRKCDVSRQGSLIVIGTRAAPTLLAKERLLEDPRIRSVTFHRANLRHEMPEGTHADEVAQIIEALDAGRDVLVGIASDEADVDHVEYGYFPWLVTMLGHALAPAGPHMGALIASGGETATAILKSLPVEGIDLVEEIEPGVALGLTLGELSIPIVTKAGGFGNADCLVHALERLRLIRQTGSVA